MKLYYEQNSGEVFYAIYDTDLFEFVYTTNLTLLEFYIDEIETNKALCIDLNRTQWKFNSLGQRKYYVSADLLYSRDGWTEYRPF